MGYSILPISELNNIDFSVLNQTADTVRTSVDSQYFIVEGEAYNQFTHEEILLYLSQNIQIWGE